MVRVVGTLEHWSWESPSKVVSVQSALFKNVQLSLEQFSHSRTKFCDTHHVPVASSFQCFCPFPFALASSETVLFNCALDLYKHLFSRFLTHLFHL